MSDLFDKIQTDLADSVKAYYEREKTAPRSVRLGPNANLQTIAERFADAAFRRIPHHRAYALDVDAKLQFGALAVACQRAGKNLPRVLEELSKDVPGMVQERPPADAGTIPPLPIDSITGERVKNPFLEPHDFKSQAVVRETSPRLAKWLEDCAKFGGPTAHMIDELEASRIDAEALRKIQYSDEQWKQNALRPGSGATMTQQSEWISSVSDPWLLQTHRREATAGSPSLKFGNLTVAMKIAKRSPEVREIHKQAEQIFKSWQQEQKEAAKAA
jgi:hypothetical protein